MLRNPCGPPSQRHQISGAWPASVRSSVRPASAKCQGRCAGRPAGTGRGRRRQRPDQRAGHVRRHRPATSPAGRTARRRGPAVPATGSAPGRRAARARPSSPSPCRGGRSRSSSSAAAPSTMRAQQLPWSPGPAGRRRLRLGRGQQAELGDEAVVVGGQLAVQPAAVTCCAPARPLSSAAESRRQRGVSVNHGNAQLATSWPAASAMTWLLAEEPRLRKAARYC